jgi:chromosome segregation ATPase
MISTWIPQKSILVLVGKKTSMLFCGVTLTLMLTLTSPTSVFAQKAPDAGAEQRRAEQLRKLSAKNQQLESEKATLQKEKDEAQASTKLVEQKSKEAQGQSAKSSRELASLRGKNAELEKSTLANASELQKLSAQVVELKEITRSQQSQIEQRMQMIASLNESNSKLQGQLKDLGASTTNQQNRNQTLTTELGNCSKNNVALVGLVDEVSDRYRKKTCGDARSLIEPLMGLRAAEFERVSEEYRAKAGDERYVRPVNRP